MPFVGDQTVVLLFRDSLIQERDGLLYLVRSDRYFLVLSVLCKTFRGTKWLMPTDTESPRDADDIEEHIREFVVKLHKARASTHESIKCRQRRKRASFGMYRLAS